MWNVDAEGEDFQAIRNAPCGLPQQQYDKLLTAFLRQLKGNAPMFANKVLKQVCLPLQN